VLFDYPSDEGRVRFEAGFEVGLEEIVKTGRIREPIELVKRQATGLPIGSAENVSAAYPELEKQAVVIVTGPCVSDNAVVNRDEPNS